MNFGFSVPHNIHWQWKTKKRTPFRYLFFVALCESRGIHKDWFLGFCDGCNKGPQYYLCVVFSVILHLKCVSVSFNKKKLLEKIINNDWRKYITFTRIINDLKATIIYYTWNACVTTILLRIYPYHVYNTLVVIYMAFLLSLSLLLFLSNEVTNSWCGYMFFYFHWNSFDASMRPVKITLWLIAVKSF